MTIERLDFRRLAPWLQPNVKCGKNSSRQRQQMRGKDNFAGSDSEMLGNLRRVPVGKQAIGAEVFVYLDEVEFTFRLLAGPRSTRFAVAYDTPTGSDPSRFHQRP